MACLPSKKESSEWRWGGSGNKWENEHLKAGLCEPSLISALSSQGERFHDSGPSSTRTFSNRTRNLTIPPRMTSPCCSLMTARSSLLPPHVRLGLSYPFTLTQPGNPLSPPPSGPPVTSSQPEHPTLGVALVVRAFDVLTLQLVDGYRAPLPESYTDNDGVHPRILRMILDDDLSVCESPLADRPRTDK